MIGKKHEAKPSDINNAKNKIFTKKWSEGTEFKVETASSPLFKEYKWLFLLTVYQIITLYQGMLYFIELFFNSDCEIYTSSGVFK